MTDLLTQITSYENGELDNTEVIELFQELLGTNMLYSLQGCYGRQAQALLDADMIAYPEEN